MYSLERPFLLILAILPLLASWLLPPVSHAGHSLYHPRYTQIKTALGKRKESRRTPLWLNLYKYFVYLLLVIAASGPVRVGTPELVLKRSRSFLIVTDISTSMNERDWTAADGSGRVTRWEGVLEFLDGFIGNRDGDKMALIAFGSHGYVQAPFTADLKLVRTLAGELRIGMAGQKTALGNAVSAGIEVFAEEELPQKVMLLITDGVDSGSDVPPLDAARIAAEEGIRIYTLGIGGQNSSSYDLDEITLKAIAETTGAVYFNASDAQTLNAVSEQLDAFEPMEYEEPEYRVIDALYFYVVAAALLLILIPFLIGALVSAFQRTGGDS